MAKKKQPGRTRRAQYDDFLQAAYKKTCAGCEIVGFEFPTQERQQQFHYALMEYGVDKYLFYDGNGVRATVVAENGKAGGFKDIAESLDGVEIRVRLDEEI